MNTSKGDALTQAYELIEADKLPDAKAILKPILETDKDNADAWWLYAHVVTDSETARLALNNVLRLDNDYPEAAELLKTLEQQSPSDKVSDSHKEPSFLPSVPATVPDLPESGSDLGDFDLPDDLEGENSRPPIYRRPVFLFAIIAILLIFAVIVVVLRPFAGPSPSPTQTVDQAPTLPAPTLSNTVETLPAATLSNTIETLPTATVSNTVQSVPTTQSEASLVPVATTEATANDSFGAVTAALGAFKIADNGINITDTSKGSTLLVSVCTTAGREMRALLPQVMDALAKANTSYGNQVAAAGVHMMDCDTGADLLTIGMSVSDAAAYASGSLTEQEFQSRWKPIQ